MLLERILNTHTHNRRGQKYPESDHVDRKSVLSRVFVQDVSRQCTFHLHCDLEHHLTLDSSHHKGKDSNRKEQGRG